MGLGERRRPRPRSVPQEGAYTAGRATAGGRDERGFTGRARAVGVRARHEKLPHHRDPPQPHRPRQRREPELLHRVRRGPGRQQGAYDLRVPTARRPAQRRVRALAEPVGRGVGHQQQSYDAGPVAHRREIQRRLAVLVHRVRAHTGAQQPYHRVLVTLVHSREEVCRGVVRAHPSTLAREGRERQSLWGCCVSPPPTHTRVCRMSYVSHSSTVLHSVQRARTRPRTGTRIRW